MLTSEERQRIEDEERKRIAEDLYRAEVRSKLQGETGAPVKQFNRLPWILGIGTALIVGAFIWVDRSSSPKVDSDDAPAPEAASRPAPVPRTRYMPVSQKIASGQIVVKANGYVQYRLTITPEMIDPTVKGTFNASGGTGNDVRAVIADEMNFTNWVNGHQAQVIWGTPGWQTTGSFEAKLGPGMYYLVFNNQGSFLFDKQVFLEAELNFRKAETYYD